MDKGNLNIGLNIDPDRTELLLKARSTLVARTEAESIGRMEYLIDIMGLCVGAQPCLLWAKVGSDKIDIMYHPITHPRHLKAWNECFKKVLAFSITTTRRSNFCRSIVD